MKEQKQNRMNIKTWCVAQKNFTYMDNSIVLLLEDNYLVATTVPHHM